jgi:hypothetical protein
MTKIARHLPLLAFFALVSFSTQADAAVTRGGGGLIDSLTVNHTTADTHAQFHGELVIKEGGTKTLRSYRWGGSSCPGLTLPTAMVDRLVAAATGRTVRVVPEYKTGQGSRCLVGFKLKPKN